MMNIELKKRVYNAIYKASAHKIAQLSDEEIAEYLVANTEELKEEKPEDLMRYINDWLIDNYDLMITI